MYIYITFDQAKGGPRSSEEIQNTGNAKIREMQWGYTWEKEGYEKSNGAKSSEGEEVSRPVPSGEQPLAQHSNLENQDKSKIKNDKLECHLLRTPASMLRVMRDYDKINGNDMEQHFLIFALTRAAEHMSLVKRNP